MTHRHFKASSARRRNGFTLVEMLVVIGIGLLLMAIVLPAINLAYNKGVRTRMAADLQAIVVALEAYRQDHGDIPRVYGSGSTPNETGEVILCRALLAPGPATGTGADGQDGYGFRTRAAISNVQQGKVYGPYLAPDKFKVDTTVATPKILDRNGKAILYFAGFKTADVAANNGYIAPFNYTGATAASIRPMFNTNDLGANGMKVFDYDGTNATTGLSKFRFLMGCNPATGGANGTDAQGPFTPAFSGEFLLWSAGPDEKYGLPNNARPSPANKCDDVANFERDEF